MKTAGFDHGSAIEFRSGGPSELKRVINLKLKMFEEVGVGSLVIPDAEAEISSVYGALLECGDLQHFVAVHETQIVACAVGIVKREAPFCFISPGFYGFLADVYTHPDFRRRGCAAILTQLALDWLKVKGVRTVRLIPSSAASPLYRRLGFRESGELSIVLQ